MKALTVVNGAAGGKLSAGVERYARISGFRVFRADDLIKEASCLPGDVLYVDRAGEEEYRDMVRRMRDAGRTVIRIPGSLIPFTYKDFADLTAFSIKPEQLEERDLIYGGLVIDREQHIMIYQGRETPFGPYEYEVLLYLLKYAGKAVSREEINQILPERKRMTDRNIDTHIKNIRRVLDMKKVIVSVRSVGYRVDPDELYNWITGSR